jgi:hypothetical protein
MPNDGIDQKLIQYLNTPMPSYAVLLRGEWGVGKSFYWNRFKNNAMPEGKQDISLSVAGLYTLEELERALFLASIKELGPGILQETGAVVGRALLRWVKVEPGDIKLKAEVRSDRTVICIDDVERFGGDFKVLFGFIVSMLDDDHLHVVLIADEGRALTLPGYSECKERIISRSFDVVAAVDDIYQGVGGGYANARIREAIVDSKHYALTFFEQKKLKNLRTVRAILDEINAILSGMRWPEVTTVSLSRLLSAVTFHAMAVSRDPLNAALVSRTFLQGDLGMALALSKRRTGRERNAEGTESEAPGIHDLIQSLGFEADAHEWPNSPSFAAYVQGRNFDPNKLATEFNIFGSPVEEDQPILVQFRSYRSMTEEQFREAETKLRSIIRGCHFMSLQDIWAAFEIWYHLSMQRLIEETPDQCRDMFLEMINECDPASELQAVLEIWPETRDGHSVAVIDALRALEARIRAVSEKATNKLLQRAIIEGVGEEPREVHLTPFLNESAVTILDRLVAEGRPAIYRMTKFFTRRFNISNIAEYTAAEAPFACALAEAIDATIPPRDHLTLDQAAFRELAIVLRRFSDFIGRTNEVAANNLKDNQDGPNSLQ